MNAIASAANTSSQSMAWCGNHALHADTIDARTSTVRITSTTKSIVEYPLRQRRKGHGRATAPADHLPDPLRCVTGRDAEVAHGREQVAIFVFVQAKKRAGRVQAKEPLKLNRDVPTIAL